MHGSSPHAVFTLVSFLAFLHWKVPRPLRGAYASQRAALRGARVSPMDLCNAADPPSKGERAIMTSCERLRKFPSAKSFRLTRRHQQFREKSVE